MGWQGEGAEADEAVVEAGAVGLLNLSRRGWLVRGMLGQQSPAREEVKTRAYILLFVPFFFCCWNWEELQLQIRSDWSGERQRSRRRIKKIQTRTPRT